MTSTSLISRLFLVLVLTGAFGCKQEEGDTCYEDDDCSGSLICACQPSTADRGICAVNEDECGDPPPEEVDLGPIEELDLGPIEELDLGTDMGEDDGGLDDGGLDDGGPEDDAGPEDDLGVDGGASEDMGEPDLGADEDMG